MSSPCELVLYASLSKATQVAKEIVATTKALERRYNFYSPTSDLTRINERKSGKLSSELFFLLDQAQKYYYATNGLFDVSIGTFKSCLHYTQYGEYQKCIQKMKSYVGWEHIKLTSTRIRFDNPYTRIDLGGLVKEYAVDRARAILKRHKIAGIINFGGDIYAVGKKVDGTPFRIGIKDPKKPNNFIKFVELENMAIATSGRYERSFSVEGERIEHIFKKPLQALSVSVIAPSCMEAGVYATSLMMEPCLEHNFKTILLL